MQASMASNSSELHFVLIPLMSPGHFLPMVDMARLLALHGMTVTIVTTPLNTVKFSSIIKRAVGSGLKINLLELEFPAVESGLPEGCESMDRIPSRELIRNFFNAASKMQDPLEQALQGLHPRTSCIISGKNLPWTAETAQKFRIPRIFFDGMGCFSFACSHKLEVSRVHEMCGPSRFEPFVVPDLPDHIVLTQAKLPEHLNQSTPDLTDVREKTKETKSMVDGIVVNSFEELETEYVKEYRKVKGSNVWCIGPVSAINKSHIDKAERGEKANIDEENCLKWLDSQEPESVIYACLGSISGLTTTQLVELALGLELSNKPFVWVLRISEKSKGLEHWMVEEDFEARVKGRGLVVRGWSPQLLILSHPAIGGFLTHCGWNSTTEGICSGVPIVACPLFAEQFYNEKLIVDVLGIGVSVGVEAAVTWGLEEKAGLVMKREQVRDAIQKVMESSEKGLKRRKRAKELGFIAKNAIKKGGSSFCNMESLICYVKQFCNEQ